MAKKSRSWIWIVIIVLILLALLSSFFMKNSFNKNKATEVIAEKVEKRTITENVSASGKVFPEIEINVSSNVSGELVELYVSEGDSVTMGQLIAKIDPEAVQSAVERVQATVDNSKSSVSNAKANLARSEAALLQSQAQKKQIEAQLENASAMFKRNEQLLKDGVISQADYDNALSSLRSLEANLEAAEATVASAQAGVKSAEHSVEAAEFSVKGAEASLKEIKTSLNRTSIYASMSGVISYIGKEKGEMVLGTTQMAGDVIARIANLSAMEVQVDVSESDVLRVSLGDDVEIEVDAYQDKKFKGKVTEISNSASNTGAMALTTDQATNFTVKIRIDRNSYRDLVNKNNRFAFRPGMSASVEINTEVQKDAMSVPIQSVTTRDDENNDKNNKEKDDDDIKEVVFIIQSDTVAMKEVTTGIQDDEYIQILSGLNGDEEIVKGPYTAVSKTLKEGNKITIKEDKFEK